MGTTRHSTRTTHWRSACSTNIMAMAPKRVKTTIPSMVPGMGMGIDIHTVMLADMDTLTSTAKLTGTIIRTLRYMSTNLYTTTTADTITLTTMAAPVMRIAELTALLHLASPALPIGAFSYSQGLESAIDAQWVTDMESARTWIESGLSNVLARCELPFLAHQLTRWRTRDAAALAEADARFIASRESAELRRESEQMGWSLKQLCLSLEWGDAHSRATLAGFVPISQPSAFAFAVAAHDLEAEAALAAYAFSWVENQAAAALKAVPLGQMAGQRIVVGLRTTIDAAVCRALATPPDAISTFAPMLGVLSARHETQYSRLFRS